MIFHKGQNPFLSPSFVQVDSPQKREKILADPSPCIVLATSGMMNGGPVIEYLKSYGHDKRNTLIFVGYQAEGTLGRRLQKGWNELPMNVNGKTEVMKVDMQVATVDGFSGHSDRRQLMEYVKRMDPRPERIITNHGDENKCLDLASSIYKKYKLETKSPMNLETIRLI
jgi:predicted metal-dependent RNase